MKRGHTCPTCGREYETADKLQAHIDGHQESRKGTKMDWDTEILTEFGGDTDAYTVIGAPTAGTYTLDDTVKSWHDNCCPHCGHDLTGDWIEWSAQWDKDGRVDERAECPECGLDIFEKD